jgi:hypothetical protein
MAAKDSRYQVRPDLTAVPLAPMALTFERSQMSEGGDGADGDLRLARPLLARTAHGDPVGATRAQAPRPKSGPGRQEWAKERLGQDAGRGGSIGAIIVGALLGDGTSIGESIRDYRAAKRIVRVTSRR